MVGECCPNYELRNRIKGGQEEIMKGLRDKGRLSGGKYLC